MNSQVAAAAPPRIPDLTLGVPDVVQHDLAYIEAVAQWASASQLFGITRAQAVSLMLIAQARGIPAIEALLRFHVIDGKPSMSAAAIQAEFQRRGGRILIHEHSGTASRIEVWHPQSHPEHVTFVQTLAELVDSHVACTWDARANKWKVKPTYVKFARQMLHARCISEAVRTIDPGAVLGTYTPEEIRDWDRSPETQGRPWARAEPESHVSAPAPPVARGDEAALLPGAETAADRTPVRPQVGRPRDEEAEPGLAEAKAFIRRAIKEATGRVRDRLALEKDLVSVQIDDIANGHQVVNALVTLWIEDGTVDPIEVSGPDGKRDKEKAIRALTWAYGRMPDEVRQDVREYLAGKEDEALRAHGLSPAEAPGEGEADSRAEGETT
jgi:hypothetical protein